MRYFGQRLGAAGLLLAITLTSLGCEERRQERKEDKGRVNVNVQTPAGGTTVDIEYPKDKDRGDKRAHD